MDLTTVTTALFSLLVFLPVLYLFNFYILWSKRANLINKVTGPKTLPLIGTTWDLVVTREEIFKVFEQRIKNYRPFFRTWMGLTPEIHIMKAEDMETVLSSTKLIQKGHIYSYLHPWLGTGLLTSQGSKWHQRRKLITPAFHFSILETFVDIFTKKSETLVKDLLEPVADGREFNICPLITRCTLDIICKTAMGVDVHAMSWANSDYVSAVYQISEIAVQRMLKPWLIPDFIFYRSRLGKRFQKCISILHGFTNKVIQDRKEILKEKQPPADTIIGKKKRKAFLDLLLESPVKLSNNDIREEVDTFMFEGHDTTAAGIYWALFLLGHHPQVQDRVVEELTDIFGNDNRTITIQDLANMKYLERVIKETLRLYPSVPFIIRKTTEMVTLGGYDIPPGTQIVMHIRDIQRDPDYFPNPEEFNPDNFLPEIAKDRHPFVYVPFSAGPRNCIGQKFALLEEKTVLATILRKYKIKSVEKLEDIHYYAELILRPQKGLKMQITPRY